MLQCRGNLITSRETHLEKEARQRLTRHQALAVTNPAGTDLGRGRVPGEGGLSCPLHLEAVGEELSPHISLSGLIKSRSWATALFSSLFRAGGRLGFQKFFIARTVTALKGQVCGFNSFPKLVSVCCICYSTLVPLSKQSQGEPPSLLSFLSLLSLLSFLFLLSLLSLFFLSLSLCVCTHAYVY